MQRVLISLETFYAENNTSQREMLVLGFVVENGRQKIKDIVEKTNCLPTSLTAILDSLERKGYVKRFTSKDDRRVVVVKPTSTGETEWSNLSKILVPAENSESEINDLRERNNELEIASAKLSYLEAYGVDNWEGYGIAMAEFNKDFGDEDAE
jgi:DNA-binding MarR family transcriptional regulator